MFNDGAYTVPHREGVKADAQLRMEHGKPLLFGKDNKKGHPLQRADRRARGGDRSARSGVTEKDVLVHDPKRDDPTIAFMLANLSTRPGFPTPIGVFRDVRRPTCEELYWETIKQVKAKKGETSLREFLSSADTWTVA